MDKELDTMMNDYVYNHLKLKDENATKRIGHLTFCAPYGEDYEALENYLKSQTKKSGANKGQRTYSDSSIQTIIKEHKSYIGYQKGKQTLNNNENMITSQKTQEHIEANQISTSLTEDNLTSNTSTVGGSNVEAPEIEQTPQTSEDNSGLQNIIPFEEDTSPVDIQQITAEAINVPPVKEKHKGGRPVSTNRSERFTLYMNADVLKDITILANYDNLSVTDLMNNTLVDLIEQRRSDIDFMTEFERRKEERKLNQRG